MLVLVLVVVVLLLLLVLLLFAIITFPYSVFHHGTNFQICHVSTWVTLFNTVQLALKPCRHFSQGFVSVMGSDSDWRQVYVAASAA